MQGVDGVKTIIKEENTPELFDFLGRYVRKTHTDDLISKKKSFSRDLLSRCH
jgi:hypothetical protein